MIDWCGWCIYSCQHWYAWVGKLGSKGKGRGTKRPNSNCLETTSQMRIHRPAPILPSTITTRNSYAQDSSRFAHICRNPFIFVSCRVIWSKEMEMFIFVLLNVFQDMYQDLGISIQFLVQINMTVSHKRYLHTNTK